MRETIERSLRRGRETFGAFTTGQKLVSVLGTIALLLGGFMVYRWAAAPTYAPLYSNLSSADASAVVDQLNTQGVPYQLSNGGNTILVPQDQVYAARISLSGKGLPADSTNQGYSLLDNQGMSLSQQAQDINYKRAMEGELAKTIEAINGVDTAVVHLVIPQKQVFSDQQDPATASVLVKTQPGITLSSDQVQAVVNLVASSIQGLTPDQVTVADATGKVLSSPGSTAADGGSEDQMISDVQEQYRSKLQSMLDRVLGVGNSTVQVIADLDFDNTVTDTHAYTDPTTPPKSVTSSSEVYNGVGTPNGVGGVVGPDGQLSPSAGASGTAGAYPTSTYSQGTTTQDNALNTVDERRVNAPGSLSSLHVGVALDTKALAAAGISLKKLNGLINATAGINATRGDTVSMNSMVFDRTQEKADAAALAQAATAQKAAARRALYKEAGLGVLVALLVLGAMIGARRRNKKREKTTEFLVEQIRQDQQSRISATQVMELPPAALALEEAEGAKGEELRREIDDLIERQPDDVAALLRGWLAERS